MNLFSLFYITVHAFFKSLMFMSCGWSIHGNFVQWVSSNYNFIFFRSFFICVINMLRLFSLSVSLLKDQILLYGNYFIIFIFIFYASATLYYSLTLLKISSFGKYKFQENDIFIITFLLFSLFNLFCFFFFNIVLKISLFVLLFLFLLIYLIKNKIYYFSFLQIIDIYYRKMNFSFNLRTFQFSFLFLTFNNFFLFIILIILFFI